MVIRENEQWVKQIISEYLNKDSLEPSIKTIKKRQWQAFPVADELLHLEAKWLAEAAEYLELKELIGISFDYGKNLNTSTQNLKISTDEIFNYWNNCHCRFSIITSEKIDFLYWKEQFNEHFIICGSPEFISKAYKCSFDTAKKMFFYYKIDDHHSTKEEENLFYKNLWNKYANLHDEKTS